MSNYDHVLIALEFQVAEDALFRKARAWCGEKVKISVIHAVEPIYYSESFLGLESKKWEAQDVDKATHSLQLVAEKNQVEKPFQHVVVGNPVVVIKEFAKNKNIDLIVVGKHSQHWLPIFMASAILNNVQSDVLVVGI